MRKWRPAGLDGRRDRDGVAAKPPRARGDHNRRSESTHRVWAQTLSPQPLQVYLVRVVRGLRSGSSSARSTHEI